MPARYEFKMNSLMYIFGVTRFSGTRFRRFLDKNIPFCTCASSGTDRTKNAARINANNDKLIAVRINIRKSNNEVAPLSSKPANSRKANLE